MSLTRRREGEAPAEPVWVEMAHAGGSPGGSPSRAFHPLADSLSCRTLNYTPGQGCPGYESGVLLKSQKPSRDPSLHL